MNPLARAASLITFTRLRELKGYTTAELLPAWKDNRPHFKDWDTENAIKEGYKASVWVYACVYRLMKDVASVPWIAQVRKGDEWLPAPDNPLTDLMEHPNPYMSRQDMMERLTAHLHLGGNGLWSKVMVRRVVSELWPIDP
jgi:phage portal protein BeeE